MPTELTFAIVNAYGKIIKTLIQFIEAFEDDIINIHICTTSFMF